MVRQYRLERMQGLEVLVCEIFRLHTWTQGEYDSYCKWKDSLKDYDSDSSSQFVFKRCLETALNDGESEFFGLTDIIPLYDSFPAIVLRGIIVDNRIANLSADYNGSVLPIEVIEEIRAFYGLLDSKHWRNTVSCQIERYGSLFESDNN